MSCFMNILLRYHKRTITQDDLNFICKVINDFRSKDRPAISRKFCEAWDWRQANRHLKDGVCRGLLLELEKRQLITLPPRIIDNNKNSTRCKKGTHLALDFQPIPLSVTLAELPEPEIRQVRRSPEEKLFNNLISQYHYPGYIQPVGKHLKLILLYAGNRLFFWLD